LGGSLPYAPGPDKEKLIWTMIANIMGRYHSVPAYPPAISKTTTGTRGSAVVALLALRNAKI